MQGRKVRKVAAEAGTDTAALPTPGAANIPKPGGGAAGGTVDVIQQAADNMYVDPALVERLRAKGRSGYGGTFLTGPAGPTILGGGG